MVFRRIIIPGIDYRVPKVLYTYFEAYSQIRYVYLGPIASVKDILLYFLTLFGVEGGEEELERGPHKYFILQESCGFAQCIQGYLNSEGEELVL